MLVVFYIISALSSFLAYMYMFRARKIKIRLCLTLIIVTLVFGTLFYIPMCSKIISTVANVNFWDVFAVASLFVWQCAFLFNDKDNLFNYEIAALLFALTLVLLSPTFDNSSYIEICREEHTDTEIVPILEEQYYGEGFFIKKTISLNSNSKTYSYYYMSQEGIPVENTIPSQFTTICYVEDEISPYLKIQISRDCYGYNTKTQSHLLTVTHTNYTLYVPKGCIVSVAENN